ncbi:unnamed protein product [Rhizoctonia solani]|uniref:rRNA-processing protein FYV7 n=1 Tax=Rhizoctonia solani TaxID=456999 RepID=A0A8H3BLZ5_9AGAM|nr:unnamed protein product [Rhizoctonia solani]
MALPAPMKSRIAPKFHAGHLDANRARKLKKEWIATQKLKAKYRAEKRRMGLRKAPGDVDGDEADGSTGDRDDIAKVDSSGWDSDSPANGPSVEADTIPQSPAGVSSRIHGTHPKPTTFQRNAKGVANGDKSEQDGPSLRELARDAYSPASLHTFKSHPLRGRTHGKTNTRTRTNPYPSLTNTNAQKGGSIRGRGQPNMAKRMGVLLEKIKRSAE